jgi:hypothetical protein
MHRVFSLVSVPAIALLLGACCGRGEKAMPIDRSKLHYFMESYEESRGQFILAAKVLKEKHRRVEIGFLPVRSEADRDLAIDYCLVPPKKKKCGLLVITCGIHGIEGLAGSAIMRMFMAEVLPDMDADRTGVLLVHGINPWGFKYLRRVTEHNVDLNRNFDVDKKLFSLKNEDYGKVDGDLLNPPETLDTRSPGYLFFPVKAARHIMKYGMDTLRRAILQGQYEFEKGIFFGGKDFEPQKAGLEKLLKRVTKGYPRVFSIDLHTGYGERGKLLFFPNPVKDNKNRKTVEDLFRGYRVDWGDAGGFYATTGDYTDYIGKLLRPGVVYIPMVIEYGTLDTHTTMGAIRSLKAVIVENQAFQHGGRTPADAEKARELFREAFFPSSPEWRSAVMGQTAEVLPVVIRRFEEMK